MSPNAHITSHRKPRRPATQSWVVRTGVAGGVLGTLAVAGTASAASNTAEKPAEQTVEIPALNAALSGSIAQSADATQQAAVEYQVRAQVDEAVEAAKAGAKKAKEEAERKAEAERKVAEAEARKAQERASRGGDRTDISGKSTSASDESTSTATGSTATLLSFLRAQLGKAYVMGSTGPSSYDCSGLVMAAYNQIGVSLPRVSQDQSTAGTQVSLSNLQAGDILYWGPAGSAYHVAVYIGGGKFIGAQNPSTGIVERDLSYSQPSGAVRVL
ncbi:MULTISPECIES: C40 family peptidase [Streptomyces]|uniref:C40 family peptidase n=1 Tax=Streptomyces luteosporeus TaxID=173856 RepID=A0ABN3TQV9_9ACTN